MRNITEHENFYRIACLIRYLNEKILLKQGHRILEYMELYGLGYNHRRGEVKERNSIWLLVIPSTLKGYEESHNQFEKYRDSLPCGSD